MQSIELANEQPFSFGAVAVRPSTREIVSGDRHDVVEPRIMQVLVALARRRGEVVSRADLIASCWAGRTVSEDVIYRCIAAVRRLAASHGGFSVSTVSRVGYRLNEIAAAPAVDTHIILARRSTFVGRVRELGLLRRLVQEALAGRGGVALVSGDAGVGKTRLTQELAADAERHGALLLVGRCRADSEPGSYAPFAEVLEALQRSGERSWFRGLIGDDAAQLAKLLPQLRSAFDDIPSAIASPPELARRHFASSLRDCLERAARGRPLVLVIEDLHWADSATLEALRLLAERVEESPILMLGTHRGGEQEVQPPLSDWLEEIVRRRLGERLALKGLDEAETAQLICQLVGQDFPRARIVGPDVTPAWVIKIHRSTAGSPFYIEEIVRHLADDGRLLDSGGRMRANVILSDVDVPAGAQLVIGKRVARLTGCAQAVLAAAAVAGSRFLIDLVLALELDEANAVRDALDEAAAAGLILADRDAYRFAHDLVRQAIVAGLPLQRRQRLHRRIADALQQRPTGDEAERALEVGRHLSEAGPLTDRADAARYLLLAGDYALEAGAFEEALGRFEAGLATLPSETTAHRADMLFGRGMCHFHLFRADEALSDFREVLGVWEQLGDADGVARTCLMLADLKWRFGRLPEAVDLCDRGLSAVGKRLTADRVRLTAAQGYYQCLLRRHEFGESRFDEADVLAERLNDPQVTARICDLRAQFYNEVGEYRASLRRALLAAQIAREIGDAGLAAASLTRAAAAHYFLAQWDEATTVLDEAEPLADRVGNQIAWTWCEVLRAAIVGLRQGISYDAADRSYWVGLTHDPFFKVTAYRHLGVDDNSKGRWEDAARWWQSGLQAAPTDADCWSSLLLIWVRLGERAQAEAMLNERLSTGASIYAYARRLGGSWGRLYAIADALVLLGRHEEAGRFYEAFAEHAPDDGYSDRILGVTAAAGARWSEAEVHFRDAIALAERLPNVPAQASCREDWARALLRRGWPGDRGEALRVLTEAAALYEQMARPRDVRYVQAIIAEAVRPAQASLGR